MYYSWHLFFINHLKGFFTVEQVEQKKAFTWNFKAINTLSIGSQSVVFV